MEIQLMKDAMKFQKILPSDMEKIICRMIEVKRKQVGFEDFEVSLLDLFSVGQSYDGSFTVYDPRFIFGHSQLTFSDCETVSSMNGEYNTDKGKVFINLDFDVDKVLETSELDKIDSVYIIYDFEHEYYKRCISLMREHYFKILDSLK